MSKRVTMRDVAEKCGLSIYTVSSALNDKGDIAEATAARVLATARSLKYDLLGNVGAARRLATRGLGLVVPKNFSELHPFFLRALVAARSMASTHGYDFKVFTEEDIETKIERYTHSMVTLGCRGLVFFCPTGDWAKFLPSLLEASIPIALIRRPFAPRRGLFTLTDDDFGGMTEVMRHLHGTHGYTRIAFAGVPGDRCDAYRIYLRDQGLAEPVQPFLEIYALDQGWATVGLKSEGRLLAACRSGEIEAVACGTDDVALRVMKILASNRISVPAQVAVTGVNDDPITRLYYPEITTCRIPVEEMMTEACQHIFGLREDDSLPEPRTMAFAQTLVVRDSCGGH